MSISRIDASFGKEDVFHGHINDMVSLYEKLSDDETNIYGSHHGVVKPLCMDCNSPTLAFEVEPTTLQGDRELRGERVKMYMIYPIVKACVETNTSLALANRVIGKDDIWVAVPESYIGEFPQGFEVRVDMPDFPFPRVGPFVLASGTWSVSWSLDEVDHWHIRFRSGTFSVCPC